MGSEALDADVEATKAQPWTSASQPQAALTSVVLRAYVMATAKCFGMVWQELCKGHVLEGEDVMLDNNNLSLFEDVPVSYCLHELDRAMHLLQSHPAIEGSAELLQRLSARSCLTIVISGFAEELAAPAGSDAISVFATDTFQMSLRRLETHFRQMGSEGAHPLRPSDLVSAPSANAAVSFDPLFSRRLQHATGVPPRAVRLPSQQSVVTIWLDTVQHWQQAEHILRPRDNQPPEDANFWRDFQAFYLTLGCLGTEKAVTPYVRSLWTSSFYVATDIGTIDLVTNFLSCTGCVSPLTVRHWIAQSDDAQSTSATQRAVNEAHSLLSHFALTMFANPPRSKRSLANAFPRWRSFTADATLAPDPSQDLRLTNPRDILSRALHCESLNIATLLVLRGFDLELYGHSEMASAYALAGRMAHEARAAKVSFTERARSTFGVEPTVETPPSDTDWLALCCEIWSHIALLCERSRQSKQRSATSTDVDWVSTASLSREVFRRRFKWLKLPSFDSHGQRQNPWSEIDSLWHVIKGEESRSIEEMEDDWQTYRWRVLALLSSARKAVHRWGVAIMERHSRWFWCRTAARELHARLTFSLEQTTDIMEVTNDLSAVVGLHLEHSDASDAALPSTAPYPWFAALPSEAPHPWFPALQRSR